MPRPVADPVGQCRLDQGRVMLFLPPEGRNLTVQDLDRPPLGHNRDGTSAPAKATPAGPAQAATRRDPSRPPSPNGQPGNVSPKATRKLSTRTHARSPNRARKLISGPGGTCACRLPVRCALRGVFCRGRLSVLAPGVLPWADLARLGNLPGVRLSPLRRAGWQRRQLRSAHPSGMAPCCPGRPATIRRPAAARKTLVRHGGIEDMRLPAGLDGPAARRNRACPLAGKLVRPQPAWRGRACSLRSGRFGGPGR